MLNLFFLVEHHVVHQLLDQLLPLLRGQRRHQKSCSATLQKSKRFYLSLQKIDFKNLALTFNISKHDQDAF
jgi:hypothetical protein